MKRLTPPENAPATILKKVIDQMVREKLAAFVRRNFDPNFCDNATISDCLALIEAHSGEQHHRFSLSCHCRVWSACISGMYSGESWDDPVEAILRAFATECYAIVFNMDLGEDSLGDYEFEP